MGILLLIITKNEEVVTEDSIYIIENKNVANSTYHRVNTYKFKFNAL